MRRGTALAAPLGAVLLTACGPSLGEYEVIDLEVVEDLPDTYQFYRKSGPQLQVRLRSDFDLATVGDTYSYKIECGWNSDSESSIAGPMAAGDPPLEISDIRDKMPRRADGKMEYLLFLPLAAAIEPSSYSDDEPDPSYDLRIDSADLCLKIIQAGYFITESRSETIRIPAADVRAALRER